LDFYKKALKIIHLSTTARNISMKGFFSHQSQPSPKKNLLSQNFLLITTSGGGGHLQAAQAKRNEVFEKYPEAKIVEKNVVETAGGKYLGKFMIDFVWNKAQRKGSVHALNLCAFSIPIFDFLFWIPIFYQIYHLLKTYDIDHVIDTQPMASSAIASAVYFYKKISNKEIFIEKVLTELPTIKSAHYLKPLARLGVKKRNLIRLSTIPPLKEPYLTEEDFWFAQAGLRQDQVMYRPLPIRPSFLKKPNLFQDPLELVISYKDEKEKNLLENLLPKNVKLDAGSYLLPLPKEDIVVSLMLGSQPPQQAFLSYVENFIAFVKNFHGVKNFWFFVFCSDKPSDPIPLQQRICSLVNSTENFPSHLRIIPMSNQKDHVIAPLYYRSDATITKAGGITSMELLQTAQGQIWIHYENSNSWIQKILGFYCKKNQGMPEWEYGNVLYLQNKKQAALITPANFYAACDACFGSKSNYLPQQELKQNPSKILSSHGA
jgi:hypothetical protein